MIPRAPQAWWTKEDEAELVGMVETGMPYGYIAKALDRSYAAIRRKIKHLRDQRGLANGKKYKTGRPFSRDDRTRAASLREEGKTFREIGAILNRRPNTISSWLGSHRPVPRPSRATPAVGAKVPARVLAERDAAYAEYRSSITAALMGDPLPGRSALERRT